MDTMDSLFADLYQRLREDCRDVDCEVAVHCRASNRTREGSLAVIHVIVVLAWIDPSLQSTRAH